MAWLHLLFIPTVLLLGIQIGIQIGLRMATGGEAAGKSPYPTHAAKHVGGAVS